MKYKIEKNTVQETLVIPLYARKVCSELYPNLYQDETAVRLIDEIDYDFSEAEKNSRSLMQRFGSLEVAMRQNDLAFEVRDYLKSSFSNSCLNVLPNVLTAYANRITSTTKMIIFNGNR